MTAISFYHLERTSLDRALPRLLEKVLERGHRAVVIAGSEERVEALNTALWTYEQQSFLPHGSAADGHADRQPVYLTAEDENPNGSDVLVLVDGVASANLETFARVLDMFDGHDSEAVEAARARWRDLKDAGHELTYWQQTAQGGWEQKG
ncbi:MAG: DNA polymerase III subunit chi [Alphaproteobacteria bacterium]|nr:DNA polymerase III subunit chi [Alphaproteobacteria bacterium]MCY4495675.1 DNA polymerase III subunit chi [Rhodospirillaceae bacterium]